MTYQVTLIPGDGIGPEVSEAARRVIDATGVPIAWEVREAGLTALESQGDVLPEETLASLKRNNVGLKGPMTTPIGSGFRSVNVGLRQALGLYANLRPGKSLTGRAERLSTTSTWWWCARTWRGCTPGSSSTPAPPRRPR